MFNLTRDERKVILFLLSLALIGLSLSFWNKRALGTAKTFTFNREILKLDLNSAGQEALLEIPGIGLTLAGRILDYRRENGCFRDKEELKTIKGITQYRYEKIEQYFR